MRMPQPTRVPSSRWMITVLPATPHSDSSALVVNPVTPPVALKPGMMFTGAASPSEVVE